MEPKNLAGVAAAAVVGAGLVVGLVLGPLLGTEEPSPVEYIANSKVAFDGGAKFYLVPVKYADGGTAVISKSEAPCKRRPIGISGALCLRVAPGSGISLPAPEGNRYPASEMLGTGCEGVACSVWAGNDAEGPETAPSRN